MPAQEVQVSSAQRPAVEPVPSPLQAHEGWKNPPWTPRLGLVAATLGLTLAGIWWVRYGPREQAPEALRSAASEAEEAPGTGTLGLGDGGVPTRVAPEQLPPSAEPIALDVPKQPLSGQRRTPCLSRGEIEINGGCWALWPALTPPCGETAYEWNGACYLPLFKRTHRVPNSTKPHP